MNEEQLRELEALAEAATPGPWWVDYRECGIGYAPIVTTATVDIATIYTDVDADDDISQNAAFIAASRSAVPALLAEVRRQQAELANWHQAFGLLTTLAPDLEIDTGDLMGMAWAIERQVRADRAALAAAIARAEAAEADRDTWRRRAEAAEARRKYDSVDAYNARISEAVRIMTQKGEVQP